MLDMDEYKTINDILFDLESERRVLSSMFHSEEACIEAYNTLAAHDFYSPKHAALYQLTIGLFEREINPTLVELLKEGNQLGLFNNTQEVEELQYISQHYIDDENIKYWIKKVKDKSRLRRFENCLLKKVINY